MKIQLKDLSMMFNEVKAVDALNITINEGELVSLLGPSGCGKSTTLYMLAGLYQPTSGEILFGDKVVNNVEPEDRNIGMVFQNYALYPHLTVLKNILFPLKMAKVPKKEANERAIKMARLVQIDHLLDRKPSQLSGGQQQRVAIARALVKKPKLLLLDEPLSNLDARLRLEMREEIKRIQQEVGITTIFVTHDQEEAMSISDKILLMKGGHIQQFSPPQDLYDYPTNQFVAEFMGNPPINLLPVLYDKDQKLFSVQGEMETFKLNVPHELIVGQGKWMLGIRPEDFILEKDRTASSIIAETVLVERIGRDTLIIMNIGGHTVRAIVSPDEKIEKGDHVYLGVRPKRVHLFDEITGDNLLNQQRVGVPEGD